MKTFATQSCAGHRPVLDDLLLAAELTRQAQTVEQLVQTLQVIQNLCNAPHWSADRRWKIRDIAEREIKQVRAEAQKIVEKLGNSTA